MYDQHPSERPFEHSLEDDVQSPEERLQYTIKGIERRSVDLMRHAAKRDGMKIGAWVSKRMREAAEASLSEGQPEYIRAYQEAEADRIQKADDSLATIINRLDELHAELKVMRENQAMLIAGLIAKGKE